MPSRYASTSHIFQEEEVLREDYRPDELPEREDELDNLHMALSPAARGVGANNAFLYGKAGQGKTAAAKTELAELEYHAEEESDRLDLTTLYISCESHDLSTSFRAASRIYMELTGNERPTGHSTDAVMDMMFEAMNDVGGTIIIVLDEIDTLGDDDRLLYSLPRARAQNYVGDHVYPSVIGISNDLQWRDNLSSKVKSSLYDDQILFSPYDAIQLKQILRRRAAKAFQDTELIPVDEADVTVEDDTIIDTGEFGSDPGEVVEIDCSGEQYVFRSEVLTSDVIPLISAFAAQDKGDARQAIKYLRKAGEIADANGIEQLDEETVRQAQSQVEKETVTEAMREMTTQAQLALAAITVLEKSGDTPVRTKPVYAIYQNIADEVGADKLVQRRMRDHLMELDMQGIIDARKRAAGSVGGPAWHFELQVAIDIVVEVLNEISRLDGLNLDKINPGKGSKISDY
ncbi:cell division control protein 6 [Halorientalis persicus]|uniref:ORC1-type DNA replication protein n=1 Tax=Halorientalis persicus TaxID=1367881 RepID=A0A1H8S6Y6_9EURY|nr:AAA family ATPase [Halorientalis persicus]SEO74297.1 cell division control protein 6 [Halorientalis persicus]